MAPWDCVTNPVECQNFGSTNEFGYPAHFDLACIFLIKNKVNGALSHFKRVLVLAPNHEYKEKIKSIFRASRSIDLSRVEVRDTV